MIEEPTGPVAAFAREGFAVIYAGPGAFLKEVRLRSMFTCERFAGIRGVSQVNAGQIRVPTACQHARPSGSRLVLWS